MKRDEKFGRENSRIRKKQHGYNSKKGKYKRWRPEDNEFRCCHCRQMVFLTDTMATAHRNHCPYCLCSLHVDTKPGNRQSLCRARMEPIGLTWKHGGYDKYGNERSGDVMLIHLCTRCAEININRIAGDDSIHGIFDVFEKSLCMDMDLRTVITQGGIHLLGAEDARRLRISIYGKNAV